MNGYEAQVTCSEDWKAYGFALFTSKEEAEEWAKQDAQRVEKFFGNKAKWRVIECEVEKCPHSFCDNLMREDENECVRCDHLRGDVE